MVGTPLCSALQSLCGIPNGRGGVDTLSFLSLSYLHGHRYYICSMRPLLNKSPLSKNAVVKGSVHGGKVETMHVDSCARMQIAILTPKLMSVYVQYLAVFLNLRSARTCMDCCLMRPISTCESAVVRNTYKICASLKVICCFLSYIEALYIKRRVRCNCLRNIKGSVLCAREEVTKL